MASIFDMDHNLLSRFFKEGEISPGEYSLLNLYVRALVPQLYGEKYNEKKDLLAIELHGESLKHVVYSCPREIAARILIHVCVLAMLTIKGFKMIHFGRTTPENISILSRVVKLLFEQEDEFELVRYEKGKFIEILVRGSYCRFDCMKTKQALKKYPQATFIHFGIDTLTPKVIRETFREIVKSEVPIFVSDRYVNKELAYHNYAKEFMATTLQEFSFKRLVYFQGEEKS